MTVNELFSLKVLDEMLRNTFSLSDDSKLKYSFNEYGSNKNVTFLDVKGDGVCQQYVLVPVLNYVQSQQDIHYPSVLQPVFVVEDNQKVAYGAFEKERLDHFVSPQQDNLEQLKTILKTLAEFQATILVKNIANEDQSEYALKDITENITSLDYFKSVEKAKINKTLGELQITFNKLLKSNVLVKSVWSSLANNVYVNQDGTESLFLEVSSSKLLPPAYDALLYIFSLSGEKFRQKHFKELMAYYFQALVGVLKKQNHEASDEITRKYTEIQLKTLLPIVKFVIADDLIKSRATSRFEEILENILNYLNYPLVQQEDVYEATKNKLLSDDYDLLSFKLVPLNEKNGHLGEYYHLKISVKFQNKEEHLNLFAKFLVVTIEMFRDIVEGSVGKKEDFFYNTLYTLYQNQGLESILDFAPKCYLTRLRGFLVLEDLGSVGYIGLKPNSVLNQGGLKIILTKLAKFHASGLIVEEILSKKSGRKIRLGDEYAEYFEESTLKYENTMQAWFDRSVDSFYYIINKFPDLSDNIPISIKEKLKDVLFSPFSVINKSNTLRNVVNHGDLYIANMLLKFGNEKTMEDGIFIDFQILRYIPPAYEVLFFIFLNSTKETRDTYLESLLDWYYVNLSDNLTQFNLDPEEIFSRKQFNEDLNNVKPASLASAFSYGHVTHIDPDFREEILHDQEKCKYYLEDNMDELVDIAWKDEHYRTVLRGLMEDFIDLLKTDAK